MVGKVEQRLTLGCYVDDLFTLYSHDGEGSLYNDFVQALTLRRNVEDEGPVSDLLNVDMSVNKSCVVLKQEKCISQLVATYLPDGVPLAFSKSRTPASESLPQMVEDALASKHSRTIPPDVLSSYQSLVGALLYCSTLTRPDVAFA
eukprot:28087-Pleurochrysis_carterae.AAC.1